MEYLRRNYKEYQRQKVPALRQQVERAVETIARKGGVSKAELVGALSSAHSPERATLVTAFDAALTRFSWFGRRKRRRSA